MAEQFEIQAEPRTDVGKGASRRLRRIEDLVPAIIYGAGEDALSITIKHNDLHKALNDAGFYSRIVTIRTGKKKDQVILKDVQRHPARDRILHVDFLRVSMDQQITVRVPLRFINEDLCAGVRTEAGQISHIEVELEISCLPGNLPEFIEVDMEDLNLGDAIHQSDLVLPEGIEATLGSQGEDVDATIATVHAPRGGLEEEEELEEGEDIEGLEEGAEEGAESTDTSADTDAGEDG
jgi:large subunit ribosomal protein L25